MTICLILVILTLIMTFAVIINAIRDEDIEVCFSALVIGLFISFILVFPFISLDKSAGMTVGTITAVDKNFFGSTAIYVKTSEKDQEKYCAEDTKIIKQAKTLIGKKVKVNYGTRVGLYDLNKCHEAPIIKIEEVKENEDE